jgi:hypothetical protein
MTELSDKERADFIADCTRCAAFYESNQGLCGPRAIVDLYNALARFAALTDPNRPALTKARSKRSKVRS